MSRDWHKTILRLTSILLFALTLSPTVRVSAGSLSIEPIREELSLKSGQSITNQLIVRNSSDKTTTVSLEAESFSVINESYDYSFAKAEDLKSWVRFSESSAELKAKGSHLFTYTVSAPASAEPGGKYIAIFSTISNEAQGSVTSLERAGTLLYITVPGAITKKASVVSAHVTAINTQRQASLSVRIRNSGTAHFRSRTKVEVRTIFNTLVSSHENEHLLLPNTLRHIQEPVMLGKLPGLYKVNITLGQGDVPANTSQRYVWYLPVLPTVFVFIVSVIALRKIIGLAKRKKT